MGHRAGRLATEMAREPVTRADGSSFSSREHSGDLDLQDLDNAVRSLMWRLVGIERDGPGLEAACGRLQTWNHLLAQRVFGDPQGWLLVNKMLVGLLIARAALARTESRGTHFRRDYDSPDDEHWLRDQDVLRPGRA
jgi:succinate dehydrogenase/fumarate reductase flavoprotein subunit